MLDIEIKELITAIRINNHYDINKWESDFIDSIESQMALDVLISARQTAKLKDIYKLCYGG